MLQLEKTNLDLIMKSEKYINYLKIIQNINIISVDYYLQFNQILTLPAKEKLDTIYNKYLQLFKSFAVKDIAHVLGIEPQSLSRVRKNIIRRI